MFLKTDYAQKNGGKLVSDINDADYVVLGHHKSQNFDHWLRQAEYFHKLAVQWLWVHQCVEEEAIVDVEEFVYGDSAKVKRRGRPTGTPQKKRSVKSELKSSKKRKVTPREDESEDQSDEEMEEQVRTPPRKTKEVNPGSSKKGIVKQEKVKVRQEKKAEQTSSRTQVLSKEPTIKGKGKQRKDPSPPATGHWAPSPPPPTRVVPHSAGKNAYTKEDLDYRDEYLQILISRNPDITLSAIAEKLHAKVCTNRTLARFGAMCQRIHAEHTRCLTTRLDHGQPRCLNNSVATISLDGNDVVRSICGKGLGWVVSQSLGQDLSQGHLRLHPRNRKQTPPKS